MPGKGSRYDTFAVSAVMVVYAVGLANPKLFTHTVRKATEQWDNKIAGS